MNIIFGYVKHGNKLYPQIHLIIFYLTILCFALSAIKLTPPIGKESTTCQNIKCYKIIIFKTSCKPKTKVILLQGGAKVGLQL